MNKDRGTSVWCHHCRSVPEKVSHLCSKGWNSKSKCHQWFYLLQFGCLDMWWDSMIYRDNLHLLTPGLSRIQPRPRPARPAAHPEAWIVCCKGLGCIINLADRREYYLLSSPYLPQNWQWEHKENPFTPWQIAFQILSSAGVILAACPRGTLTMLVFVRLKGKGYHGISCKHAGTWCRWQRSAASSVLESWWRWRMSITMSVWRHYDCWLLTND